MIKKILLLLTIASVPYVSYAQDAEECLVDPVVQDQMYAKSFPAYLKQAEDGDDEAMRLLGVCYQNGLGTDADIIEALKWYGKAAAAGNLEALYDVGVLYSDGIGLRQDYSEAAYWFRKAARNGHPKSMLMIGRFFEEGLGVLPDDRIAAENYWKAAENGDVPEAQYRLACMYRDGKGMDQNYAKARYWFGRAAEHGYPDAQEQMLMLPEPAKKPAAAKPVKK